MRSRCFFILAAFVACFCFASWLGAQPASTSLWNLAQQERSNHRFSTLFTAHDPRQHLATPEGLQQAIDWCKQTGVSKVYLECFRDGFRAERATLENAKKAFESAGLEASGCVTTTRVGKS